MGDLKENNAKVNNEIKEINNNCNCTEKLTIINIISIGKNDVKLECSKKHEFKMSIIGFLKIVERDKIPKANTDLCIIHNLKYDCYCVKCDTHLCEKCLDLREHSFHFKYYIKEINPKKERVRKIKEKIKVEKNKIEKLISQKVNQEIKLKNICFQNMMKIEETKDKRKTKYKNEENNEIKKIKENYKIKCKKLGDISEIKNIKMEYINNINSIRNKYKIKNGRNECVYKYKSDKLIKIYPSKLNNFQKSEKITEIGKKSNFIKFIEYLYDIYINNERNYFNIKNIETIYDYYFKNNKNDLSKNESKENNDNVNKDKNETTKLNNSFLDFLKNKINFDDIKKKSVNIFNNIINYIQNKIWIYFNGTKKLLTNLTNIINKISFKYIFQKIMSVIEYMVIFFKKAINELILCILSITKEIEFLFIPSDITIYNSNEIDYLYNSFEQSKSIENQDFINNLESKNDKCIKIKFYPEICSTLNGNEIENNSESLSINGSTISNNSDKNNSFSFINCPLFSFNFSNNTNKIKFKNDNDKNKLMLFYLFINRIIGSINKIISKIVDLFPLNLIFGEKLKNNILNYLNDSNNDE